MPGCLYLVSTPIGNLEDITLRAVRLLKQADVIAAEDPARTKPLVELYGIETPVTSYHNQNKAEKAPVLIQRLRDGQHVALVVDAGTPVIADPGAFLLLRTLEAGIRVTTVPGPSAVLAALSISGLPSDAFLFAGPLPETQAARRRLLQTLAREPRTLVFFESAGRLRSAMETIRDLFGNRRLVLAMNLTTPRELTHRGTVQQLLDELTWPVDGEVALVLAGYRGRRGARRRGKARRAR